MAEGRHSRQTVAQGRHASVRVRYADATDRGTDTRSDGPPGLGAFGTDDHGTIAQQDDDDSLWMLQSTGPNVWIPAGGGAGSDTDAIHDNVANEIAPITLKASPAGADHVLIEDTAAANAKKRTTAAAIAASGPPAAHTHTESDITDLDHTDVDAIHDNVPGEIAAVADADVAPADRFLYEDASDSDNKKSDTVQGIIDLVPTKSILAFGDNNIGTSTTTRYLYPWIMDGQAAHTSEIILFEVPYAGTIRNMRVVHNVVGVGGATLTYTARKNSTNQTLAVAIGATAAGGNDTSNSFTVVAGDKLSVSVTKSASITTSPSHPMVTMELFAT